MTLFGVRITNMKRILTLSLLLLTFAFGCSSSGGPLSFIFVGNWKMNYNVVSDDCGLLVGDTLTFTDTQKVSETNDTYTFTTESLPSGSYSGVKRAENSVLATLTTAGDIFGIGLYCETEENLSFDNLNGDSVDSLYTFTLLCEDGTACESAFRGTGVRQ